jgi:multidrug efflux pump
MNLTQLAIKNKSLFYSLLVVFLFLGANTFVDMSRDDMPPFLIRVVSIVSTFPGAGPERVELLVSDAIEKVVQEVPEVDYITSESRTGLSVVTVSLKESVSDLQPVFDRIRRKVESVQSDLPAGVNPVVNDELGDVFGILIGLTADGYSYAEMKEIADEARNRFIKIPDAAKVEIVGEQPERIYLEFDQTRLAEMGLSKTAIENLLSSTNILYSGGDIRIADERIILEPSGNFESVVELERMFLTSNKGELIRLGDVAKVRRGYVDPPQSLVRVNGEGALVIGINLKKGGNIVQLGHQVDILLTDFKQIYPIGVDFLRVSSQDQVVDLSVSSFVSNLLQAVGIVLATMLVFLGLRTGFVVASLIPSSIVLTLLFMSLLDVGLNQVSLAALVIALGMLVDNAIVMSESMMVKMEEGESPNDAAVSSCQELSIPLLVSSLTTAAAFMAFFLAASSMGEIMGQLFLVVTSALLSSWMMSLTVIPLLAIQFVRITPLESDAKPGLIDKAKVVYRKLLVFCLKKPALLVTSALLLFVVSIWGISFLPFVFMPDSDKTVISANLELPIGSAIEKTDRVVLQIENFINEELKVSSNREEGVVSWSSYVGEGAPKYDLGYSSPEANSYSAHILINTTSDAFNQEVIERLDRYCLDNFPDLKTVVDRLSTAGGAADPVSIRLTGNDPLVLDPITAAVKAQLRQIAGTKNVTDDWGMRVKKLVVKVDPLRAQLAGLTNQDVALSLQTILTGARVGDYREGDQVIPITMLSDKRKNLTVEQLESLPINSQGGTLNVPLKQVADIDLVWQPAKILRRDLSRTISVGAGLQTGYTAKDITSKLVPWLEQEATTWPRGYSYKLGGESEDSNKAMGAVIDKLPISFFIILLLLIGQFNSVKKATIVLLTIPLGLIGVVGGLLLARSFFGFMGFLGLISLAGIVINNAIVLLDRIKIEIDEYGREPGEAIVEAGVQRFRPIILTTATTSLGLIPLWMFGGLMWEPMAIGIIFGLLFATLLTLLFVPTLYKIFFRVEM